MNTPYNLHGHIFLCAGCGKELTNQDLCIHAGERRFCKMSCVDRYSAEIEKSIKGWGEK